MRILLDTYVNFIKEWEQIIQDKDRAKAESYLEVHQTHLASVQDATFLMYLKLAITFDWDYYYPLARQCSIPISGGWVYAAYAAAFRDSHRYQLAWGFYQSYVPTDYQLDFAVVFLNDIATIADRGRLIDVVTTKRTSNSQVLLDLMQKYTIGV